MCTQKPGTSSITLDPAHIRPCRQKQGMEWRTKKKVRINFQCRALESLKRVNIHLMKLSFIIDFLPPLIALRHKHRSRRNTDEREKKTWDFHFWNNRDFRHPSPTHVCYCNYDMPDHFENMFIFTWTKLKHFSPFAVCICRLHQRFCCCSSLKPLILI